MMDITLEKIDKIVERLGVSYKDAKDALIEANGDVLEAIIALETKGAKSTYAQLKSEESNEYSYNEASTCSVEDFKTWIKKVIEKGNVSRIKIKKDEVVILDIPVNAGISAMVIAAIIPAFLAFGVIAAVATKITIEITKCDGSVEVVNKYVKKMADEVMEKATVVASEVKEKATQTAMDVKEKLSDVRNDMKYKNENKSKVYSGDDTVYTYTVKFDEE
ncbi:DUF4342 domain-containing protein [Clostridium thermobutyricum]|uniref:DUF4342 domain-containing protein n=1 Tax=Clostridium thermobutyricum TaxID=29372 RepID=UPI0018AB9A51|nr:DUF4342 domain-containing protein [Clostridium thermobutyricum]